MDSKSKTFAVIITVILAMSLLTLPTVKPACAQTTTANYFILPDSNATITLLNNASYIQATFYPAHHSSTGIPVPESWDFEYSVDYLSISAENCNLTIKAFNIQTQKATQQHLYNVYSWLNYTVKGVGNQTIDYNRLYNSNSRNPMVYIDSIARQQGNGWNWTNYGITVYGAHSSVSINQEDAIDEPPRLPLPENVNMILTLIYGAVFIAIAIIIVLVIYRRHRKTVKANQ